MYSTKASILFLYQRIFGGVRWFRRTCTGILGYIAAYCTAVTIAGILQCIPIMAAFDQTIKDKKCIDNITFGYINAFVSIATDLAILILPMKPVYHLQVPRTQRAAIMFAFALGAL